MGCCDLCYAKIDKFFLLAKDSSLVQDGQGKKECKSHLLFIQQGLLGEQTVDAVNKKIGNVMMLVQSHRPVHLRLVRIRPVRPS